MSELTADVIFEARHKLAYSTEHRGRNVKSQTGTTVMDIDPQTANHTNWVISPSECEQLANTITTHAKAFGGVHCHALHNRIWYLKSDCIRTRQWDLTRSHHNDNRTFAELYQQCVGMNIQK